MEGVLNRQRQPAAAAAGEPGSAAETQIWANGDSEGGSGGREEKNLQSQVCFELSCSFTLDQTLCLTGCCLKVEYVSDNTATCLTMIKTSGTCAPLTSGGMMIWEPCLDETCCPPRTSGGGMTAPELRPASIWWQQSDKRQIRGSPCSVVVG